MFSSKELITELKSTLKQQAITYAMLASKIGVSEASIKRIFSTHHCSLKRLDSICAALDIDLADLIYLTSASNKAISYLSEEQEYELLKNTKLLLVAVCARNRWSFDDIIKNYKIDTPECITLLAHLDRIKFIELLPNNKIKLLVANDFRWRPKGPIEKFYEKNVASDYLNYQFEENSELRIFLSGELTINSQTIIKKKIEALAAEFQELRKLDSTEPLETRSSFGMALALRNWELDVFRSLRILI